MPGTRWVGLGAAALVAIVVVGAAVASRDDDDRDPAARSACILQKREHARYVVVSAAYARGELGPRRQVLRSVHPRALGAIFERDGDLRRWASMGEPARNEFLDWAASDRIYARTGQAQERAADAVERADCE
jgi:hypothetical protein